MSYKTRSARRLAQKGRRNFLISLTLIAFIIFATITWILPTFIGSVGFVRDTIKPSQKQKSAVEENPMLAAPVLNIPYEATNSPQIDIKGYTTPEAKIKLYVDDAEVKETKAETDGSFVFEDISLSLGANEIYAKSFDDNNKESLPSKHFKVAFDNEKPTLSLSEPEDNKKIQGGDKKVKISGKTETGAKVLINDSQVVVDSGGNFSTDLQINEGDNTITIKAADLAGNTSEIQRKVIFQP